MNFAESHVEEAALEWLAEIGWATANGFLIGPDGPETERDNYGDVVLTGRLAAAIERLNPGLSSDERAGVLAKVLQARFELLAPARFTALYADEGTVAELVDQHTATTAPDPTGVDGVAEDIWQRLSPNERLLLPYLDEDAHHAAQLLEIRQGHAAAVLENLKTLLRTALSSDSDPHAVMTALLRRCGDALS